MNELLVMGASLNNTHTDFDDVNVGSLNNNNVNNNVNI